MRTTLLRYGLTTTILAVALAVPLRGQVLEYELPETFDLYPGRLAVTFGDTVRVDLAMALVEKLPLDSTRVEFFPVLLTARWVGPLRPTVLDSLRGHPGVRSVLTGGAFLGRAPDPAYARERAPDLVQDPITGLAVLFEPHTPASQIQHLVALYPSLRLERIDKRPNEILLYFDPSREEAVLSALESSPLVEYLSYVARP